MNWIGILLLIIHVGACSALILIVLLQAGKGASLGAAFGGGASQTVFGARSATFIGRLTWVLFAAFLITSTLLTIIPPWGKRGSVPRSDILQEEAVPPSSDNTAAPQTGTSNTLSGDVTQPQTAPPGAAEKPMIPEQAGKDKQSAVPVPADSKKSAEKPAGSAPSTKK